MNIPKLGTIAMAIQINMINGFNYTNSEKCANISFSKIKFLYGKFARI